MPELPEVEVIRCGLAPLVIGQRIHDIYYSGKKMRLPVALDGLKRSAVGQRILALARRGKYLLFELENRAHLVIHLGMTGRLGVFPVGGERLRHDHFCLLFEDGRELRFNDTRRFGSVQIFATAAESGNFFDGLGPEPFSDEFSPERLLARAKNKKQPVKNFLMDSRVVVGIGNIYASEVLFVAGVRPLKEAGRINLKTWRKIIAATRLVLEKAIACGGTTISDFVNSAGESGYFQLELQTYGRAGLPCKKCGQPINKTVMAGRATYFCGRCQK